MAYQGHVSSYDSPLRSRLGVYEGGARRQERLSGQIGESAMAFGESVKDFAVNKRAQQKLGMYDQQRRLNTAMAAHKLSLEDVDRKLYKNHGSRAAAMDAFQKRQEEFSKASSDRTYTGNLAVEFADMFRKTKGWDLKKDKDGNPLDPMTLPKVSFGEWLRQGGHIDERYLDYDHTPTLSIIKEVVSEIQGKDVGDIFDRVAVDPGPKKEDPGLGKVVDENIMILPDGSLNPEFKAENADLAAVVATQEAETIASKAGLNEKDTPKYTGYSWAPGITKEERENAERDLEVFNKQQDAAALMDVEQGSATETDTAKVIDLDEPQLETEAVPDEGITKINRGYWGGKDLSDEEVNNLQALSDMTKEDVKGWATDKSGKKLRAIYLKGLLEYLPGGINDLKKMPKLMKLLSDPSYDPGKWGPPTGKATGSMGYQWFELFGEAEADVSGDIKEAIDKWHQDFAKEFLMTKENKKEFPKYKENSDKF